MRQIGQGDPEFWSKIQINKHIYPFLSKTFSYYLDYIINQFVKNIMIIKYIIFFVSSVYVNPYQIKFLFTLSGIYLKSGFKAFYNNITINSVQA